MAGLFYCRLSEFAQFAIGRVAAAMIAERFTPGLSCADPVRFPGFAELAAGPSIRRAFTLMVHARSPLFAVAHNACAGDQKAR